MVQNQNWSFQEYKTIFDEIAIDGDKILSKLNNRSWTFVLDRALRMGIVPNKAFTKEEDEICKTFGGTLGPAVCFLLPNRCPAEVTKRLSVLKEVK